MWTLTKKFRFEAAHVLPRHDGKCRRLHGHSWQGEVIVRGDQLCREGPKAGMVVDFGDMKQPIKEMVDRYLDHHYLNETLPMENPTSEEVARWCYNFLQPLLPRLVAVVIEETCTSRCEYRPEPG